MTATSAGRGVQTVRRVITYTLLFVMVLLAALGLGGLLERLLDAGNELVARDSFGLAQSLAFALIAGPLAAGLWWLIWRGLADERERSSVAWALYLAFVSTVALIVSASALLSAVAALVGGRWHPGELATGIVWAGVWVWHRWMLRHLAKGPTRLHGVAAVVGSFYGLVIGVGGAVTAFAAVLSAGTEALSGTEAVGGPWWQPVLQSLVWAAGGALIWWWFWLRRGGRRLHTGFARVLLVIITGFGAPLLCLAGIAVTLFVLLRLAFDPGPLAERLDPLGMAASAALIGGLVWRYHQGVIASGPRPVGQASRLVSSGVALAAAASGLGVVINSILAAVGTPLAEGGLRALLLGGISALLVGGPTWWLLWRPLDRDEERATTGLRVYLVAVFGISTLVALITLILIAFRLFEFGLADVSGDSVLDRVRAPVGVLTATVLVAAYHFAIWRRGLADAPPASTRIAAISQVILVTGSDPEPLKHWIDEAIGASVTTWARADAAPSTVGAQQLAAALQGIRARRVLVVAGPGDRLDVVPLQG